MFKVEEILIKKQLIQKATQFSVIPTKDILLFKIPLSYNPYKKC